MELAAFHSPAMALELGVSWAHPTPRGCGGKTSLNIWKSTVHVLLKPDLENFEHYFTSM